MGDASGNMDLTSLVFTPLLQNMPYSLENASPVSGLQTSVLNVAFKPDVFKFSQRSYLLSLRMQTETTGAASDVSLEIHVNGAPAPGLFSASPAQGTAFQTAFTTSAYLWADPDLPLEFEVAIVMDSGLELTVTDRNLASVSEPQTFPSGNQQLGFSLTLRLRVYDRLGVASEKHLTVTSTPATSAQETTNAAASSLTSALASDTPDLSAVQSATFGLAASLAVANCSSAPNCVALNRFLCSDIPHTCGQCLGSHPFGDEGPGNSPCTATRSISLFIYLSFFLSLCLSLSLSLLFSFFISLSLPFSLSLPLCLSQPVSHYLNL